MLKKCLCVLNIVNNRNLPGKSASTMVPKSHIGSVQEGYILNGLFYVLTEKLKGRFNLAEAVIQMCVSNVLFCRGKFAS